jgi:hypothetical protein
VAVGASVDVPVAVGDDGTVLDGAEVGVGVALAVGVALGVAV